jgi:hypothetical protein
VGTVVAAEPHRVDSSGARRKPRPHVTLLTEDPVRLPPGRAVASPDRPGQSAKIISVGSEAGAKTEVVLELTGGMGRGLVPAPGSVPEIGQRLCYTSLVDGYQPIGAFPPREQTPWTHGGPPAEHVPTDEESLEEWS